VSGRASGRSGGARRGGWGTLARLAYWLAGAVASAAALAGCGGASAADQGVVRGAHATIYVSVPLEGPQRPVALDVLRGERLALRATGDRVAGRRVRLVTLDAATLGAGGWDPGRISVNARRAAADPTAVAYLGELDVGASAISIPLLNEKGLLEVSPLDTAKALTLRSAAVAGSPERYYPNQQRFGRTFARVVPSDAVQAGALLRWMQAGGVRRLALLSDEDPTQQALADAVQAGARAHGIAVVDAEDVDPSASGYADVVASVRAHRPDAALYAGGLLQGGAARLWRQLAAADRRLALYVPGAMVQQEFLASIGAAAAATRATRPVLSLRAYPPAARRVARSFVRAYGEAPGPEALYGYEAMAAVLAAVDRAAGAAEGSLTRAGIVRAFFATRRGGESVLGPYAIDRAGDTSLHVYGGYEIRAGRPRYAVALRG
jgi:branched-chain amino acid transport system substrate-binding protein